MLFRSGDVDMFNNTIIYIDEFVGFTKQEYEIIKQLAKAASMLTVSICSDSIEEGISPESDVFYSNKITITRLYDMAVNAEIPIEDIITNMVFDSRVFDDSKHNSIDNI